MIIGTDTSAYQQEIDHRKMVKAGAAGAQPHH